MKLVLHIGMPKCGSSALEKGLAASRDILLEYGVYYPYAPITRDTHNILVAAIAPVEKISTYVMWKVQSGKINIQEILDKWIKDCQEEVERLKINILILSGEIFFLIGNEENLPELRKFLEQITDDIEIVVYVRRPSEYYLSSLQEIVKKTALFSHPRQVQYRYVIEAYRRHVTDKIHVVDYATARIESGGILKNFTTHFLPHVPIEQLRELSSTFNQTLSPEGMALMQNYNTLFHSGGVEKFNPDSRQLLTAVMQTDRMLGAKKPVLTPEIAEAVDFGSPDVLWLRDTYGIVFEGLDYTRVGAALAPQNQYTKIEDLCAVDQERYHRLTMEALRTLAEAIITKEEEKKALKEEKKALAFQIAQAAAKKKPKGLFQKLTENTRSIFAKS